MAGTMKNMVDKAGDAIGGMAGRMTASMVDGAQGFVEQASISDRYEIAAAQIALGRARHEEVRSRARQMILDHTANTHHLQAALEMNETNGISQPPGGLDKRRETMITHLREAPEEEFDRTYLDQQIMAHEEAAALMNNYAANGDNAQLRSVALGALPVIERHRERMVMTRNKL